MIQEMWEASKVSIEWNRKNYAAIIIQKQWKEYLANKVELVLPKVKRKIVKKKKKKPKKKVVEEKPQVSFSEFLKLKI